MEPSVAHGICSTTMLVACIGIAGAVGQDYGAPRGYPQYNNGYGLDLTCEHVA